MNKRLCGLRPTGRLHVGHWFSVILAGREEGVDVLIANYHAPTEVATESTVATLRRYGVRSIRMQREVFDADLFFRLLNLAPFGELHRMPQFKSAPEEAKTAQLLTYPVLMTHDVVGYDEVIVGEDQEVHLEYARKMIRRYNAAFGTSYAEPKSKIAVGRVRDLRKSDQKMSKSTPEGCLFLDDAADAIQSKLKAAVADAAGRENLEFLYRSFVGGEPPAMNSELKSQLADAMIAAFAV